MSRLTPMKEFQFSRTERAFSSKSCHLGAFQNSTKPICRFSLEITSAFFSSKFRSTLSILILQDILLLERLDADKLKSSPCSLWRVLRLTFRDSGTCDDVLEKGLDFDGALLRLLLAYSSLRTVFLRDLPVEISDADQLSTVIAMLFRPCKNGNCVVKILPSKDIPGFVQIDGFDCLVWYSRQAPRCAVCFESVHCSLACPPSGHMARECVRSWGPSTSVINYLL